MDPVSLPPTPIPAPARVKPQDAASILDELRAKEKPAESAEASPIVTPVDQQACEQRPKSEFEAQDPSCVFPGSKTSDGANTTPVDPEQKSTLRERMNRPSFGEVVADVGPQLETAIEAEKQSPGSTQAQWSETAAQAGLSSEVVQQAGTFVSSLPADQQAAATVYLDHLMKERGTALGNEGMKQVLGQLTEMNGRQYDSRLGSSAEVVVSALKDIAAPTDIDQGGNTDTCSATAAQIALSMTNPQRYLQMVDTLAQNKPFEQFEPDWSFTGEGQRDGETITAMDSYRSPTAKLVQNAIMEHAFPSSDYTSPTNLGAKVDGSAFGADEIDSARTFQAVLGSAQPPLVHHIEKNINGENEYPDSDVVRNMPAAQVLESLAAYAPSADKPVLMAYKDPELGTGHAVLVTGYENGYVTFVDPTGGRVRRVSAEELAPHIWSVNLPQQ